jgi:hypothetical protein
MTATVRADIELGDPVPYRLARGQDLRAPGARGIFEVGDSPPEFFARMVKDPGDWQEPVPPWATDDPAPAPDADQALALQGLLMEVGGRVHGAVFRATTAPDFEDRLMAALREDWPPADLARRFPPSVLWEAAAVLDPPGHEDGPASSPAHQHNRVAARLFREACELADRGDQP